jgi:serine/threonine protein kinase
MGIGGEGKFGQGKFALRTTNNKIKGRSRGIMPTLSTEDAAAAAVDLDLVGSADLANVWRELGSHDVPVDRFGSELVRRELLTGYQWDRLKGGNRQGFYFGQAKILYQAGAGSFARVYRAIHLESGEIVAVKVLRKRFSSDRDKCELFLREGRMGMLLRHPGIVRTDDVGQENGSSYLIMEFVEGQTLRELVKIRGGLDLGRGIDMALQLVRALEYAHGEGITHRDLKASNVLVSSTGTAKVVDFGLASFVEGKGKKSDEVGKLRTVDYAALETAGRVRGDDVRSDVFFLGTLLYLLFAGRSALLDTRDRAIRSDPQRFAAIEPLGKVAPHLPRDLTDVIGKMLVVKPKDRYQSATEVRQALEPIYTRYAETPPADQSGVVLPAASGKQLKKGPATPAGQSKPKIMLVEVTGKSQDSIRQFFSDKGFRVLVTENARRALTRFESVPRPADVLLLSSQVLGREAVEVFNALAPDPYLKNIPAVLITSARQAELAAEAVEDDLRHVVTMPFKASNLLQLVHGLIAPAS